MAGCANLVSRPFSFFRPFHFLPEKPWGRGCCCAICFLAPRLLLKCGGSTQSRVRWSAFKGRLFRRTVVPSHPTPVFLCDPTTQTSERTHQIKYGFGVYLKHVPTLFEPTRGSFYVPAYWQEWIAKTWLTAQLTTPERAQCWGKSCKGILLQGWPGLAYFKTRDLRPARNMMSSCSLAQKQQPSTPRTVSLVPWFGYRVGSVKLQSNGCELGTRIPTILFALIFAWDFKMAAESQQEVPKR